jgi:hypothetical protein
MAAKLDILGRFAWFLFESDDILFCLFWLTWISSSSTALDPEGELSMVVASCCGLLDAERCREMMASGG